MNIRKVLIGSAVVVVGLPMLLVLIAVASISVLNRTNGTLVSGGRRREYLFYVPRSYDRTKPAPLVISMHAAGLWPAAQMATTRWNRLADEQGFIVVYPAGGFGSLAKAWSMKSDSGRTGEVQFISALIDKLEASYNIDPSRIYANGFSNGGAMTFVLSCTMPDRIAAVGMVSAAQEVPWSWCPDTRPMPMIAFHGTADPIVPYDGGRSWVSPRSFPAVRAWTANWARRNRCAANAVESAVAPDVTRAQYTTCADNADVVLYSIDGGGHSWPGGKPMPEWIAGPTNGSIDATRLMWTFFREHPRPSAQRSPSRLTRIDAR